VGNPEVRTPTPEVEPASTGGGLEAGALGSPRAGGALTVNLFTKRERGSREELKVELVVLKRGYSVYLRLKTIDQRLALRVYERLQQIVKELEAEGFESPKLFRLPPGW